MSYELVKTKQWLRKYVYTLTRTEILYNWAGHKAINIRRKIRLVAQYLKHDILIDSG